MARLNLRERTIDAKIAILSTGHVPDLTTLFGTGDRGAFSDAPERDGRSEIQWHPTHLGKVGGCELRVRLSANGGSDVDAVLDGADALVVSLQGRNDARAEDRALVELVRASLARGGRSLGDVPTLLQVAANDVTPAELLGVRTDGDDPPLLTRPPTLDGLIASLDDAIQLVLGAIRQQARGKATPVKLAPVEPSPAARAPALVATDAPAGAPPPSADDVRAWVAQAIDEQLRGAAERLDVALERHLQTRSAADEARDTDRARRTELALNDLSSRWASQLSERLQHVEATLADRIEQLATRNAALHAQTADQAGAAASESARRLEDLRKQEATVAAALAELGRRSASFSDDVGELATRLDEQAREGTSRELRLDERAEQLTERLREQLEAAFERGRVALEDRLEASLLRDDALAVALAEVGRRVTAHAGELSELGARIALRESSDSHRGEAVSVQLSALRDRLDAVVLDVAAMQAAVSGLHRPLEAIGRTVATRDAMRTAFEGLMQREHAVFATLQRCEGGASELRDSVLGLTRLAFEINDAVRPIDATVGAIPDALRKSGAQLEKVLAASIGASQRALEARLDVAHERIAEVRERSENGLEQARATHELLAQSVEENKKRGWFR